MKFNHLEFVAEAGKNRHGQPLWRLRCDCGVECVKIASAVRTGRTSSCGHLKSAGNRRTHGHRQRNSREYVAWCNMKARCDNPGHIGYHCYGGRGIRYVDRWQSFETFVADMGECPEGMTLERKDVNGPYSPENCCWASRHVQSRNKRVNRNVTFNGETRCVKDWAAHLGLSESTLVFRFRRGMPIERALQPKIYHRHVPDGLRSTSTEIRA